MGGKIDIYDWQGVDLVTNPYQRQKGSFERAQNIEFSKVAGKGGFRKRAGLSAINSSALSTPLRGAISVPLPGVNQRYIYTTINTGWQRTPLSSPGTFTAQSDIPNALTVESTPVTSDLICEPTLIVGRQVVYFDGTGSTGDKMRLFAFDGEISTEIARFNEEYDATSLYMGVLCLHRGQICASVTANAGATVSIYLIDPVTGVYSAIGTGTSFSHNATEYPRGGVSFLGRLFIGTHRYGANTGRILYLRDGDSTWTQDRAAAANHLGYRALTVYAGNLYAGTWAKSGTAAIIEKRTPAGTWSTSLTGSTSASINFFRGMVVHQDELYAVYENADASVSKVYKFDGTSWTTDLDMAAQSGGNIQGIVSAGPDLFLAEATGTTIWRKHSGTWAQIADVPSEGHFMVA